MVGSPRKPSIPDALPSDVVLVIDDEPQIRRVVRNALGGLSVRFMEASTGTEGLDIAAAEQPALVILDLGLPDRDGADVCRDLRTFTQAPIIVLSARGSDREKEKLLDAGADDYVTKPFSTIELAARTVKREGEIIHLTRTEWNLLRAFVAHAGQTMTHSQLFSAVWGSDTSGDAQQYLRVYVGQLRRKLEADPVRPRLIRTESAVGYRFELGDT